MIGVVSVVILYLLVNFVYVYVLSPQGLAKTTTPASDVMRFALGPTGASLIAAGIAISTLGFLSQGMLTAPRVYFAMAEDGLFFKSVAWVHPKTLAPVVAIAVQGALAIVIALWGSYGTDPELRRLRRFHFLWVDGDLHFPVASKEDRARGRHPRSWSSDHYRTFRCRLLASRHQYDLPLP